MSMLRVKAEIAIQNDNDLFEDIVDTVKDLMVEAKKDFRTITKLSIEPASDDFTWLCCVEGEGHT